MAKMKTEKNENDTMKRLVFFIIILVLIALNLVVFINEHTDKKQATLNEVNENYDPKNVVIEIADDATIEKSMQNNISQMGERNRCQTYIGEFLTWTEEGNYDKAYNSLNSDFKTTYFPTIDDFKNYIGMNFPRSSVLEYDDIERQAPYYVVTVKMSDDTNRNFATITKRFVVKENGNNDFEISFQIQ